MAALHLFKIEAKRQIHPILWVFLISLLLNLIFSSRSGDAIYSDLNVLMNQCIGLYLPIYIFIDFYRDMYVGMNLLNHMVPVRTSLHFVIKALVLALGVIAIWATSLIQVFFSEQGLYAVRMQSSSHPVMGIWYITAAKFASTGCGLAIVGLAAALGRRISCKRLAIAAMIGIVAGITLVLFWLNQHGAAHPGQWMLGTSSIESYKQYAGFLTINFPEPYMNSDIYDTVRWDSVGINAAVALAVSLVAGRMFNSSKYEVYGKLGA